jgi:penicillin-insensitive murein DD-endopeptidase
MDFLRQKRGQSMRTARLFALAVACALSVAGASLLRSSGMSLSALNYIGPLRADPQQGDGTGSVPVAPDPAHPMPASGAPFPDFVPGPHALSNSAQSVPAVEEPEGQSQGQPLTTSSDGTTTGSVTTHGSSVARPVSIKVEPIPGTEGAAPAKAPVWPQLIGAKNLFGAAKTPAPLAARAIGTYARGCLSGAVPLPIDGPAWQEMRLSRNRNWGHPKLIALVEQFAKEAQKLDGWPGLLVGDIAQPRGGPMISGHASHQIGLDADIWLTPMPDHRLTSKEREDLQATSMLDKTELAVDPKIFTEKQVALIKRAASYPEVERIFVHPAIKKALCKAAGTDDKWLGKVRPYYGHYYHFHVRIKCPEGFGGCTPQVPPTGDDGCGKEVDQWLARVVPSKTPETPPAPGAKATPPKVPIMLSELPKECQALLAAEPEPIAVPKDALMTPVQVKKVLAKAAQVNAALASAAGVAGGKTATGLAKSPALRPHLRKAATADPK